MCFLKGYVSICGSYTPGRGCVRVLAMSGFFSPDDLFEVCCLVKDECDKNETIINSKDKI